MTHAGWNYHNAYLYLFIENDERRRIKIGHTWNLKLRRRQLSRQIRSELTVVGYKFYAFNWDAESVENDLHRSFQGGKKKTEWYEYDPKIVAKFFSQDGVVRCN